MRPPGIVIGGSGGNYRMPAGNPALVFARGAQADPHGGANPFPGVFRAGQEEQTAMN